MGVLRFCDAKQPVKVYQHKTAAPRHTRLYLLDTWQMSANRRKRDRYAFLVALICFALFVAVAIYFSARLKP